MLEALFFKSMAKFPGLGARLYIDPSDLPVGSQAIVDCSTHGVMVSNYGEVVVSDEGPAPGMKSLYFNRATYRYLRMPWQALPNLRTGDFTLDFFYKPETQPVGSACAVGQWKQVVGEGGFIGIINADNTAFSFGPDSDFTPMFQVQGGNPLGWSRHTFVREADRFRYYRNRELVAEKFIDVSGPPIQVDWTIGAYFDPQGNVPQGGGVPLSGWLARVGVWDQALYP